MLMRPRAGGASSAASASWWRIRRTAGADDVYFGLAELDFGSPATGGTAFASSTASATTYPPENAFDGDPETAWRTGAWKHVDGYIGYQFPSPITVSAVTITAINSATGAATAPTGFVVEHSDDGGATWATAWVVEGEPNWLPGETRTFNAPA